MSRNAPPTMATKEVRFRKQTFDSDCDLRSDGNCWKPSQSGRTAEFDVKTTSFPANHPKQRGFTAGTKHRIKAMESQTGAMYHLALFLSCLPYANRRPVCKLPKCLKESFSFQHPKGMSGLPNKSDKGRTNSVLLEIADCLANLKIHEIQTNGKFNC